VVIGKGKFRWWVDIEKGIYTLGRSSDKYAAPRWI
jgi:hypothetical protein